MDEKEVLISRCLDNKKKAADSYMIANTCFLSVDERNAVLITHREYSADVDTFYFGGYEDAERTVAVYVPKLFGVKDINEYFSENPDECPIDLIRITKDKFSSLGHRDYLGSIMGLGIKREMIGDIVVGEENCFVFALRSMSSYICENLSKAGRGTVKCETVGLSEFSPGEDNSQTVFSSVASLRLDSVLSSAFNLSRSASSETIKSGFVYVNSVQILKGDFAVKEKDKIVLRGRGKAIIEEVIGESKKGRIHINIKKFK